MSAILDHKRKPPRELTGRAVLLWLIGFFAVVFAVNGVLVQAATSTFRGLETGSSYQAGLIFKQEALSAERQDALHWQVSGKITRDGAGQAVLDVSARDANGLPLAGLIATAHLAHPANASLDHDIPIRPAVGGVFHGSAEAQPGQWELIVDLYRGDERLFRSRSRVSLR
jgi:nitrogen fixation protein FixH